MTAIPPSISFRPKPINANPDDGWHNPRVLIIFSVIFLCGLACGAAVMDLYMHSKLVRPMAILTARELQQELHMTPEQRTAVDRELDEYAKYYQNIEEERQSVAEHGKENILRVLNPEQQKRFLQIFQFPSAAPCPTDASAKATP